jgi:threonine/homoserine/homoserine lactone efflux protein
MAHSLLAFAIFAGLVTITPGVDTMLVVRISAASGRRAGLAAVAGIVLGCLVWAALSALGVSAMLAASRLGFEVLRAAGVAYLLWLGVRALWGTRRRTRRPATTIPETATTPVTQTSRSAWRTGLATNLLNPKVGAFYLSVLPAFLPTGVPALAGALGLGAIHAVEGMIWLALLVALVGRARAWLTRPGVARRLEQLTGLVFVGFGVRLALEQAPG